MNNRFFCVNAPQGQTPQAYVIVPPQQFVSVPTTSGVQRFRNPQQVTLQRLQNPQQLTLQRLQNPQPLQQLTQQRLQNPQPLQQLTLQRVQNPQQLQQLTLQRLQNPQQPMQQRPIYVLAPAQQQLGFSQATAELVQQGISIDDIYETCDEETQTEPDWVEPEHKDIHLTKDLSVDKATQTEQEWETHDPGDSSEGELVIDI